ncbi:unnamed protein product [Caenorhabditis bovis]|uniref:MATH domain-containing protein n=1 Tax=Caenorhabditis bovis TaxID=2654633 RepID=A0A8S1EHX0_9PELO|nr:unnamed protein product [Caenorhabditis bovis]
MENEPSKDSKVDDDATMMSGDTDSPLSSKSFNALEENIPRGDETEKNKDDESETANCSPTTRLIINAQQASNSSSVGSSECVGETIEKTTTPQTENSDRDIIESTNECLDSSSSVKATEESENLAEAKKNDIPQAENIFIAEMLREYLEEFGRRTSEDEESSTPEPDESNQIEEKASNSSFTSEVLQKLLAECGCPATDDEDSSPEAEDINQDETGTSDNFFSADVIKKLMKECGCPSTDDEQSASPEGEKKNNDEAIASSSSIFTTDCLRKYLEECGCPISDDDDSSTTDPEDNQDEPETSNNFFAAEVLKKFMEQFGDPVADDDKAFNAEGKRDFSEFTPEALSQFLEECGKITMENNIPSMLQPSSSSKNEAASCSNSLEVSTNDLEKQPRIPPLRLKVVVSQKEGSTVPECSINSCSTSTKNVMKVRVVKEGDKTKQYVIGVNGRCIAQRSRNFRQKGMVDPDPSSANIPAVVDNDADVATIQKSVRESSETTLTALNPPIIIEQDANTTICQDEQSHTEVRNAATSTGDIADDSSDIIDVCGLDDEPSCALACTGEVGEASGHDEEGGGTSGIVEGEGGGHSGVVNGEGQSGDIDLDIDTDITMHTRINYSRARKLCPRHQHKVGTRRRIMNTVSIQTDETAEYGPLVLDPDDPSSSEGSLRLMIQNFRNMGDTVRGPTKRIQNVAWRIMVMPRQHVVQKKGTQKCLGFFLQCVPDAYSDTWSCQAAAELRLMSQKPGVPHFTRKTNHVYTAKENDWGYSCFMTWTDILDEAQGYLKDDRVVLEVQVKAEPPKNIVGLEEFRKTVNSWYDLAELQYSRGKIDLAIEANAQGLKYCKDKDPECRRKLDDQKTYFIEMKLVESIQRIESAAKRHPSDMKTDGDSISNQTALRMALTSNNRNKNKNKKFLKNMRPRAPTPNTQSKVTTNTVVKAENAKTVQQKQEAVQQKQTKQAQPKTQPKSQTQKKQENPQKNTDEAQKLKLDEKKKMSEKKELVEDKRTATVRVVAPLKKVELVKRIEFARKDIPEIKGNVIESRPIKKDEKKADKTKTAEKANAEIKKTTDQLKTETPKTTEKEKREATKPSDNVKTESQKSLERKNSDSEKSEEKSNAESQISVEKAQTESQRSAENVEEKKPVEEKKAIAENRGNAPKSEEKPKVDKAKFVEKPIPITKPLIDKNQKKPDRKANEVVQQGCFNPLLFNGTNPMSWAKRSKAEDELFTEVAFQFSDFEDSPRSREHYVNRIFKYMAEQMRTLGSLAGHLKNVKHSIILHNIQQLHHFADSAFDIELQRQATIRKAISNAKEYMRRSNRGYRKLTIEGDSTDWDVGLLFSDEKIIYRRDIIERESTFLDGRIRLFWDALGGMQKTLMKIECEAEEAASTSSENDERQHDGCPKPKRSKVDLSLECEYCIYESRKMVDNEAQTDFLLDCDGEIENQMSKTPKIIIKTKEKPAQKIVEIKNENHTALDSPNLPDINNSSIMELIHPFTIKEANGEPTSEQAMGALNLLALNITSTRQVINKAEEILMVLAHNQPDDPLRKALRDISKLAGIAYIENEEKYRPVSPVLFEPFTDEDCSYLNNKVLSGHHKEKKIMTAQIQKLETYRNKFLNCVFLDRDDCERLIRGAQIIHQKMVDYEKKMKEFQRVNDELDARHRKAEKTLKDEVKQAKSQHNSERDRNNQLNKELKEKNKLVKNLENKVNSLQSEKEDVVEKQKQLQKELQGVQKRASDDAQKYKREVHQLTDQKKHLQSDMSSISTENKQMHNQLDDRIKEIKKLKEELATEKNKVNQINKVSQEHQERAKRAEISLLQHQLESGLAILDRALLDARKKMKEMDDAASNRARSANEVSICLQSRDEWSQIIDTITKSIEKTKAEHEAHIELIRNGKSMVSLPTLVVPKPPPPPQIVKIAPIAPVEPTKPTPGVIGSRPQSHIGQVSSSATTAPQSSTASRPISPGSRAPGSPINGNNKPSTSSSPARHAPIGTRPNGTVVAGCSAESNTITSTNNPWTWSDSLSTITESINPSKRFGNEDRSNFFSNDLFTSLSSLSSPWANDDQWNTTINNLTLNLNSTTSSFLNPLNIQQSHQQFQSLVGVIAKKLGMEFGKTSELISDYCRDHKIHYQVLSNDEGIIEKIREYYKKRLHHMRMSAPPGAAPGYMSNSLVSVMERSPFNLMGEQMNPMNDRSGSFPGMEKWPFASMNAHQIITGALNEGEHVYAIGYIEGLIFTACAVGSDVVILDSDFNRVQIIPEVEKNCLVTSISCCQETGKIAVTYGNVVRILEAISGGVDKSRLKSAIFQFLWVETHCFCVKDHITSVLWTMEGMRMLFVIKNELVLYQHRSVSNVNCGGSSATVMFSIAEEDVKESQSWETIWSFEMSNKPKYIRYSPDGAYLAICGTDDATIKVFYQNNTRHSISFTYLTLSHPTTVCGFEWRKTGRYMPKKFIQAALISWCTDNTSRIWKETPPVEMSMIDLTGEGGGEPLWEKQKSRKLFGKPIRVKKTKNKILSKLKNILPEKKQKMEDNAIGLRAQIGKSTSFSELHNLNMEHIDVQFHLAATVNAETDCLLVPSMDSTHRKPLCVHWLNNKELVFSVGAEKLLAEAVLMENESSRTGSQPISMESSPDREMTQQIANGHIGNDRPGSAFCGSVCSDTPSNKDILDVKFEILLRQWTKTNDVLFTIHPIDGSLLTWTVEWLDDHYRQPVISYSSRLPNALPHSDAVSLHSNLSTFNPHEPIYINVLRRNVDEKENDVVHEKLLEQHVSNTIHILTSHENGTLNLWHMSVDDKSCFSQVLNMTHISRMCGHRFKIQQVVAHPVLPLLLTTSNFESKNSAMDYTSEVILWKIAPVGPLCKSGGVKELARVASPLAEGFSTLGWVPAILPSCTLGTVCNSPSSCFIASDGEKLVIYQAVIDARGLLAELSNADAAYNKNKFLDDDDSDRMLRTPSPRRSFAPSFIREFNVVSTQSTAKPGCVLEVGLIEDNFLKNVNLTFLHVFQARLVIRNEEEWTNPDGTVPLGSVIDRSKTTAFKDEYFIVMVDHEDTILMYSLTISSQQPQPIPNFDTEILPDEKGLLRPASPMAPSMAKLKFETKLVCRQKFPLASGTRIKNVTPAAGHLSSSSLYPACETPYVLITSDTDDSVRFWKCVKNQDNIDSTDIYEWCEWNMISENRPSELGMEGAVYDITAAHSGRIALAYENSGAITNDMNCIEVAVFECESSGGVEWLREDSFEIKQSKFLTMPRAHQVELSMYNHPERQSELLQAMQQRLNTGPVKGPSPDLKRVIESGIAPATRDVQIDVNTMVKLDWVSTEDGGHMLTVGFGAKVYIYTQVSHDPAQQNVTLMKESETSMRRPSLRKASSLLPNMQPHSRLTKWICCRVLSLDSADGLPPIPTSLSWARDGILIVGMESEMRVYNQWNFETPNENSAVNRRSTNPHIVSLPVSTSHSMLDQVNKKKEALASSRSRVFLDLVSNMHRSHMKDGDSQLVMEIIATEGAFEAAHLCSPILPQYHPKQLIVLLNAGKTKRVKAILLHVLTSLKQRQVSVHNPLSRAASLRRMSTVDGVEEQANRDTIIPKFDEDSLEYDEIDDIPPLPLYALLAADHDNEQIGEKAESVMTKDENEYDDLFEDETVPDDLDDMLKDNDGSTSRSRLQSCGSGDIKQEKLVSTVFTAKHYRKLTELLTHTHLPGLSSVDQMHLLAIADTLSHFTSDVIDKLTQANAAMQPVIQSVLGDSAAGGYATAAGGMETVDECGLRYLMAMKQHEYLLVCLPYKQRMELKKTGLAPAHIIWAQHSETETELLNAVPGMQKAAATWEELRALGIAWWLKNTASLRICVEKLAKAAFQLNQDPMDASLYYLALKKKNVMTHLFKTTRNQMMTDFFMNDFNSEHWKKVAAKNAFVLMSKQRFHHAAAFFLLSGSLKDAIQTILAKCNDLQLALVVIRLYEQDIDVQQTMIKEILCREVLGMSPDEFEAQRGKTDDDATLGIHASREPFVRSMAFWMLKDYSRAAHTLVQEAHSNRNHTSLSDIFNFYSFLRKHPLVVRQRLTDAGVQVGSTEKFLSIGKQLESIVIPPERRLFFRTAAEHMARGCPMLALDVLSRLPRKISMVQDYNDALKAFLGGGNAQTNEPDLETVENVDWSAPTNVVKDDELDLKWSDDEEEEIQKIDEEAHEPESTNETKQLTFDTALDIDTSGLTSNHLIGTMDIFAQHLKFVASLRILTEELSTLASGFEVDGGQLRFQLFNWIEKEVEVLKHSCDYRVNVDLDDSAGFDEEDSPVALHEALKMDRSEMIARIKICSRRRKWLTANQKLLRSFTSFCALHSAQNHRLTSALMELLLLLLEVQKDTGVQHLNEPIPDMNSLPLIEASVSSAKMFVSSPLAFIENQCSDLLTTVCEMHDVPDMNKGLQKCYMLYNLCQGLSSCLYQSLSDVDQLSGDQFRFDGKPGILTKRTRAVSMSTEDMRVTTAPVKWPGVECLIALLGREKDDEAPHLRLLLVESFVAITMSLFCFAIAAYDSRWLYRLSAHEIDPSKFGLIFGGGGEKRLKTIPPARPPRPTSPRIKKPSESESIDGSTLRSRLNLRVFGPDSSPAHVQHSPVNEQIISKWIPPQKNIVQLYADRPIIAGTEDLGINYDSDDEEDDENTRSDDGEDTMKCENADPNSFAWQLLRLALIQQHLYRLRQFLILAGYDPNEIPAIAPRIEAVLRQLENWSEQQEQRLKEFPGGIPSDLLPDMTLDLSDQHLAATMKKYSVIVKPNNTPFESDDKKVQPIQRLWAFLVREDHLQEIFIKYIFAQQCQMENATNRIDILTGVDQHQTLPEAFKIIQKDNEPIVAFGCNQESPGGYIVVSNGRELQEMDISDIFEDQLDKTSWMWNRAELDMNNIHRKRDPIRDNDDYQLFTETIPSTNPRNTNVILKRNVAGVRRIDSHPTAPFYVTGSSDGSIRVWKWGGREVVYTARVAGQHAKVSKISFSCNGNKFAAVDGDGMLCLWQASQSTEQRKPFFSQRCHNKSASDVRFLGHSSSVLVTAGSSSLDYNLGLWDTLLPQNRALVHSWVAHTEGATCAMYLPCQQTIVSGGRHGEICLWDIRQRQLRATIKAFEPTQMVKALVTDVSQDLIVAGSSDGDIKIWSADFNPQLMYSLIGEHATKSGFSFRQVGQTTVQGVQQLFIDQQMHLFSCGADASLKFRTLPSIFNMTNLV